MSYLTVLALALLPLASAINCPNPPEIPVIDVKTNKYTAAVMYQGPGHEFPFQACNGPSLTFVDDERISADGASFYEVGSMIVKAGCNFYGFQEPGFSGLEITHSGPRVLSNLGDAEAFNYGLGRGFRSWYTDCKMAYIDCQPEDKFEVILTCDATHAETDSTCGYTKKIGTSYTQEISESMSYDVTIEQSMKASFFGLFESSIGISITTGFDWGYVSSETMDQEQTYEVSATAPVGKVLIIEQAVGHCGGSTVNTEMFRISHQAKDGKITRREIVQHKFM